MALPDSENGVGERIQWENGKAILNLFFTVLLIDAIAVIVFYILVKVLGWDQMIPLILVIVVSLITGFYFQWKKKIIEGWLKIFNRIAIYFFQPEIDLKIPARDRLEFF